MKERDERERKLINFFLPFTFPHSSNTAFFYLPRSKIMTDQQAEEDIYTPLDKLLNSKETPLAQRFRALFTLKSLGGPRAIEVIAKGTLPISRTKALLNLPERVLEANPSLSK
jgi:hypothetical protein